MTTSVKLSTIFAILVYIISVSSLNIQKSKRIIQQPLRVLAPPDINTSSGNKYLSLSATFDIEDDEVPIISAEQEYYNEKEVEPVSENSEQIYSINDEEEMPNKSPEQTYTSDYDEQESTENSKLAYNIEQDEPVTNKSDETVNIDDVKQVLASKSSEQTYNIEQQEEVPNKKLQKTYNEAEEHEQADTNSFKESHNVGEDDQLSDKKSEQRHNTERYPETPKKTLKQRYQQNKEVPRKSFVQTESRSRNFNTDYVSTKTPKTFPKRTEEATTIVPIIENENYVFAYNGDYHYSYKGADGTQAFERGEKKTAKAGGAVDAVVGGYSYTDKDGNDFSLTYTAGENGYRPVGAHLPTPPPIPPAIQRVLRILATKTTPEPVTESLNNYDYN